MSHNCKHLISLSFLIFSMVSQASLYDQTQPYSSVNDVIDRCEAKKGQWGAKCGKKLDRFLTKDNILDMPI